MKTQTTEPNQSLQTMTFAVTPAAAHPSRQRMSCLILGKETTKPHAIKLLCATSALLLLLQGCRKADSRALQAPQYEVVQFIIEEIGGTRKVFSEDTSLWTSGALRLDYTASLKDENYSIKIRYLGWKPQSDMYGVELSGSVFGGSSYSVRDIAPLEDIFPDGFPVSPEDKVSVRIKVRKKNETEPNQAMQTIPVAVTSAAYAPAAPSTFMSDLSGRQKK